MPKLPAKKPDTPTKVHVRKGSDNVFADLGFPDADSHLLKAQLVSKMSGLIDDAKLTQLAVAVATGVSQPDISRILRGQFRDVSVERLMRMLARLGCSIDIVVRSGTPRARKSVIRFSQAA
jgi:predicted XRE-type DNA-binding protein